MCAKERRQIYGRIANYDPIRFRRATAKLLRLKLAFRLPPHLDHSKPVSDMRLGPYLIDVLYARALKSSNKCKVRASTELRKEWLIYSQSRAHLRKVTVKVTADFIRSFISLGQLLGHIDWNDVSSPIALTAFFRFVRVNRFIRTAPFRLIQPFFRNAMLKEPITYIFRTTQR